MSSSRSTQPGSGRGHAAQAWISRADDSVRLCSRGRLVGLAIAVVSVTALVGCAAAAETPKPETSSPAIPDSEDGDPGYSDPGYSDPGYSDPGNSDPGNTDPGNTDPGNTDPGNTNPCAFPGDPLCPDTPVQVPAPDLGPPGGW
jgi:hypothetical protein